MNCYDFDKTIYRSDSSMDFYLFCLKRNKKIFRRLPRQCVAFVRHYVLKTISKTKMKEIFYEYFCDIADIDNTIQAFWQAKKHKIKDFYLAQKQPNDVIISASPEFFLRPVCKSLGISHLIASPIDPLTGRCNGLNCHGEEKVRQFRSLYPDAKIEEFYSDSLSDTPLAKLAEKAYLVKGDNIINWPFTD